MEWQSPCRQLRRCLRSGSARPPSAATVKCSASRRPRRCSIVLVSISPCRPSATVTAPHPSSCDCSRTAGRWKSAAPRRQPTASPFARPFTSRRTPARLPSTRSRFRRGPATSCRRTTRAACSSSRPRGRAACCWCRGRPASSTASCSAPGAAIPVSRWIQSYARARTNRAATRSTCRPVRNAGARSRLDTRRRGPSCSRTTRWSSPTSKARR